MFKIELFRENVVEIPRHAQSKLGRIPGDLVQRADVDRIGAPTTAENASV